MQFFMIAIVLLFSIAIVVYALPVLLYVVPLAVIGVIISLIADSIHDHSKPAGH